MHSNQNTGGEMNHTENYYCVEDLVQVDYFEVKGQNTSNIHEVEVDNSVQDTGGVGKDKLVAGKGKGQHMGMNMDNVG